MTVFKTFWKILNKNKVIVIIYTVMLLIFGISNMQTSEKSMNFVASKPDVVIVNYDEEKGITKDFIKYITDNSNIVEIETDEEKIKIITSGTPGLKIKEHTYPEGGFFIVADFTELKGKKYKDMVINTSRKARVMATTLPFNLNTRLLYTTNGLSI